MARSEALARAEGIYRTSFTENPTMEELRDQFDGMTAQLSVPEDVRVEENEARGVPVLTAVAPGADRSRLLIWLHGGGYTIGSARGFAGLAARISVAGGLPVAVPDYRLAPENPAPAALEDATAVLEWAIAEFGAENVAIGGDSAGGGLAFATLINHRDRGGVMPACVVTISPLLDLAATGESVDTNAHSDVTVSRESITGLGGAYLQGHDATDPLVSPLYGELAGLPPTRFLVSSTEVLYDDSRRMADRLSKAGVEVAVSEYEDMVHVWPLFATFLPEGETAITEVADFVRSRLREGVGANADR